MRNQPEVREQMFNLIEQWQQSSLTQNAFCNSNLSSIMYFIIGINAIVNSRWLLTMIHHL